VVDEPAGEVVAVEERAVGDQKRDACFEGEQAGGAVAEGCGEVVSVHGGVSGGSDGCRSDVAVGGDAEVDVLGSAGGGGVGLGELAGGGGEADAESFGFAGPALALGLGDAGAEVVADLLQSASLGGVDAQEGTSDAPLTELTAMFQQFMTGFGQ